MRILITGDFCTQNRVDNVLKQKKYEALFGGVKSTIRSYDYGIVNFEFPIVNGAGKPILKCGPALKGEPEAIDALRYAGFNVCTLANNHVLDQGEDSLVYTKKLLEKSAIKTVGAGRNLGEAEEVLELECEGERIAIVNCCEHEFSIASDNSAGANPLNVIKQYNTIQYCQKNCDYVVVIVHGGIEHFPFPTNRMKETYRFFIDAGANAVINHHQHCYCGYETYKGRPIFYGLGNFLFDWEGKRNTLWNEGVMVGITFEKNKDPQFEVYPFDQSNDEPCVVLKDEKGKKDFEVRNAEKNRIIQDDRLLDYEYQKFVKEQKKEYQLLVEPYDSRLSKGLFNRGLLPSMISKAKLVKLLNYIYCESHQEVMVSVLKDLMLEKK